jgi:transcriptional regulator with XRE-family HTH domain
MTILPTTQVSKTSALRNASKGDMAYACIRAQHQVHNLLAKTIKESGISQKELARITGIDEATISRLTRRPRNTEINTLSKLLYGASGATLTVTLAYPETGRSVVLVSRANVAVDEKKTDTRRFVFENVRHHTPVGIDYTASTDKFGRLATIASGSGRIREIMTNA